MVVVPMGRGSAAAAMSLFLVFLLQRGALGVALSAEQGARESQTMRREANLASSDATNVQGEVESTAKVMQKGTAALSDATNVHVEVDPTANTLVKTQPMNEAKDEEADDESMAMEFCNFDFPLGESGTNNCTDNDKHALILQQNMCREASIQSGATLTRAGFTASTKWVHSHPKGCVKYACPEDSSKVCYSYNCKLCGSGEWPASKRLEGAPVCSRPKYLNGTENGNGGCPDAYEVISHEDTCHQAATCLGYCEIGEFRKGLTNRSESLEYPSGCFIDHLTGCVFFNPPSSLGTGNDVRGTPICNVTTSTSWPAA